MGLVGLVGRGAGRVVFIRGGGGELDVGLWELDGGEVPYAKLRAEGMSGRPYGAGMELGSSFRPYRDDVGEPY